MSRRYRHAQLGTAGLAAGFGGWAYLGTPGSWAGLGALEAAGLFVVPVVIVFAWFGPVAVLGLAVPRSWRAAHRYRHGREFCRSARIPARIRRAVYAADRYQCVACDQARGRMHVDHVMPWAAGGMTSLFNLMVLCQSCNLTKGYYWEWPGGHASYIPVEGGTPSKRRAAEILAAERRARWNPMRWWRAAIAI